MFLAMEQSQQMQLRLKAQAGSETAGCARSSSSSQDNTMAVARQRRILPCERHADESSAKSNILQM